MLLSQFRRSSGTMAHSMEGEGRIDPQQPGGLLVPTPAKRDALVKDYEATAGMIFGDAPSPEVVFASVEALDNIVNNASPAASPGQGEAR